jgi:beta-1,4-mannosyltransferase
MKSYLWDNYALYKLTVLMDKPPERYGALELDEQIKFLQTLEETKGIDRSKTKIMVTSTSYTADEPLEPLLSALIKYNETQNPDLPEILLLITGRGPLKQRYQEIINESSLSSADSTKKCTAKMVWLQPGDYPKLLACANLGISLHTSSSGVDFPMKIVDLFGCGVPVCAFRFEAY